MEQNENTNINDIIEDKDIGINSNNYQESIITNCEQAYTYIDIIRNLMNNNSGLLVKTSEIAHQEVNTNHDDNSSPIKCKILYSIQYDETIFIFSITDIKISNINNVYPLGEYQLIFINNSNPNIVIGVINRKRTLSDRELCLRLQSHVR